MKKSVTIFLGLTFVSDYDSGCATKTLYVTQIHLPIEHRNSTSNLLIQKTLVVFLPPHNMLAFLSIITDCTLPEFSPPNDDRTPAFCLPPLFFLAQMSQMNDLKKNLLMYEKICYHICRLDFFSRS